jgi:hypothetical protein
LVSNSVRRGWERRGEWSKKEREREREREAKTVLQHQTGVVDERRAVEESRRALLKNMKER